MKNVVITFSILAILFFGGCGFLGMALVSQSPQWMMPTVSAVVIANLTFIFLSLINSRLAGGLLVAAGVSYLAVQATLLLPSGLAAAREPGSLWFILIVALALLAKSTIVILLGFEKFSNSDVSSHAWNIGKVSANFVASWTMNYVLVALNGLVALGFVTLVLSISEGAAPVVVAFGFAFLNVSVMSAILSKKTGWKIAFYILGTIDLIVALFCLFVLSKFSSADSPLALWSCIAFVALFGFKGAATFTFVFRQGQQP